MKPSIIVDNSGIVAGKTELQIRSSFDIWQVGIFVGIRCGVLGVVVGVEWYTSVLPGVCCPGFLQSTGFFIIQRHGCDTGAWSGAAVGVAEKDEITHAVCVY
jgi:hypothetical protein